MSLSRQGRHEEAIAAAQREVEEVRESATDGPGVLATVLNIVVCVLQIGGRYQEAVTAFRQSIEASMLMNDQEQQRIKRLIGLCNLGETRCLLGDGMAAKQSFEEAL
ncbi:MAG: tetratricopeptide repeat protein, partial [Planctomycetes bacterium]|nr:tetratricopeptide repeat protein [Planctomycetota bacterium]